MKTSRTSRVVPICVCVQLSPWSCSLYRVQGPGLESQSFTQGDLSEAGQMQTPPAHVLARLDDIIVGQEEAKDGAGTTPRHVLLQNCDDDDDDAAFGIEEAPHRPLRHPGVSRSRRQRGHPARGPRRETAHECGRRRAAGAQKAQGEWARARSVAQASPPPRRRLPVSPQHLNTNKHLRQELPAERAPHAARRRDVPQGVDNNISPVEPQALQRRR